MRCFDCTSADVSTTIVDHEFDYGIGEKTVVLKATIPVFHCNSCNAEFTGYEASLIMHDVVIKYLENNNG